MAWATAPAECLLLGREICATDERQVRLADLRERDVVDQRLGVGGFAATTSKAVIAASPPS